MADGGRGHAMDINTETAKQCKRNTTNELQITNKYDAMSCGSLSANVLCASKTKRVSLRCPTAKARVT